VDCSTIASSELAARVVERMMWPEDPEGFEYRFCLPCSPVIHVLIEKNTGVLVAFRILNGRFVPIRKSEQIDTDKCGHHNLAGGDVN
jgi:hypothetical protein